MKALIVSKVNQSQKGGIEAQQMLLMKTLEKRKFNTTIVEPGKYKSNLLSKLSRLIGVYTLNKAVIREKYDLILVNDPHITLPTVLTLFKSGKKVLFSHGWIFHNEKNVIVTHLFKIYLKCISKYFTLVSCTSYNDAQYLGKASNVVVMGNPVRLSRTKNFEKSPGSLVIISRNASNKNIQLMQKVVLSLLDQQHLEKIHIVGTAATQFIEHPQIFKYEHASQSELENIYASTQFFLSLSKYEGFGLALIEAMSYGCTPIVSNIEAYLEHSNVIDQYIDLNDGYDKMIMGIVGIIKSDNEQAKYSSYADKYNPDRFLNQILGYTGLLENKR